MGNLMGYLTWFDCCDVVKLHARKAVVLALSAQILENMPPVTEGVACAAAWALDVSRRWAIGEASADEVHSAYYTITSAILDCNTTQRVADVVTATSNAEPDSAKLIAAAVDMVISNSTQQDIDWFDCRDVVGATSATVAIADSINETMSPIDSCVVVHAIDSIVAARILDDMAHPDEYDANRFEFVGRLKAWSDSRRWGTYRELYGLGRAGDYIWRSSEGRFITHDELTPEEACILDELEEKYGPNEYVNQ